VKKPLTCFTCGKTGHISRECRSRPQGEAVKAPVAAEVPAAPAGTLKKSEVTCFRCHQKGHTSPNCPSRPKGNRRVKIQSDKLLYLQPNELFGQVGRHSMPITCDSGAQISVVLEECVEAGEFTGVGQTLEDFHTGKVTGRVCNIMFTIAGKQFPKKAVTLPRELLRWTPCMAIPLAPRTEMDFVLEQMAIKEASDREETRYHPLELDGDLLISGLMVSEGVVVSPKPGKVKSVQEPVVEDRERDPGVETLIEKGEECVKELVESEEVREEEGSSVEATDDRVRSDVGDLIEGKDVASVSE